MYNYYKYFILLSLKLFLDCKLDENKTKKVLEGLSNSTQLLHLFFGFNSITASNIPSLIKVIHNCRSLKDLVLFGIYLLLIFIIFIIGNNMDDQTIFELSKCFSSIPQLEALSLGGINM